MCIVPIVMSVPFTSIVLATGPFAAPKIVQRRWERIAAENGRHRLRTTRQIGAILHKQNEKTRQWAFFFFSFLSYIAIMAELSTFVTIASVGEKRLEAIAVVGLKHNHAVLKNNKNGEK